MRILHFAPRVSWPLDTGAKLRNYHLGRVLSERAEVTLLAFTDADQPLAALESFYQQVITVPRDKRYTLSKKVRGLLGRTPLTVLNYTTDSMKRALEGVLSEQAFDIVQIESVHLLDYFPVILEAKHRPRVICDWHNIESELMVRYSRREPNMLKRAYAGKTARLMSECERRALQEFDAHIAVSQRDAERLRDLNGAARVFVIENGVDTAYYAGTPKASAPAIGSPDSNSKAHRIVFVGSMDYHANIDGAVSFARDVWPELHAGHPELVFTIVGRDPAPEVRAQAKQRSIEVTGTIDDVRPFYREALAAVVPLKVGGGSRLKILEAMAAGVPVVSTTLGAEGLNVHDGADILIADSNQQLAEKINSVIASKELGERLSVAGLALVSEEYDWSRLGTKLFEIYRELIRTEQSH